MKRKNISKRLRFKVFERDNFICQYCGKHPPEVILHLDHVYPVSKGGSDDIENLLTACSDCNLGKSSLKLGSTPKNFVIGKEELQERYDQLKSFYKLQNKINFLKDTMIADVESHWNQLWERSLTEKGIASFKMFLRIFSVYEIKEAMDTARAKMKSPEDGFRYTCGILHTIRKENDQKKNG